MRVCTIGTLLRPLGSGFYEYGCGWQCAERDSFAVARFQCYPVYCWWWVEHSLITLSESELQAGGVLSVSWRCCTFRPL